MAAKVFSLNILSLEAISCHMRHGKVLLHQSSALISSVGYITKTYA